MKENTGPGSTIKDTEELYEPGGRGSGTGGGRFEYKKLFQRDQELKIIDDMIGVVPGVANREQCEHIVGLVSKYYFPKTAETYGGSSDITKNEESHDRKGHLHWCSYLDEPWIMDNYVRPWVHEYNKQITKFDIDWWADHQGQLCKYSEPGDYFDWHRDHMLDTREHLASHDGSFPPRKITISLQLSQHGKDYEGCALLVGNCRPQEDDPMLQQGTLTIFPSWMRHKVTPLTSGTRWSWTYWFEGPPWK